MFLEVCQNCPVTPVCDTERAYVDACVTRSADSMQEKTYPSGMCVCVCIFRNVCYMATRLSTSTFVQVVECVHLLKRSRLNALVHFKICMLKKKRNPWSSECTAQGNGLV